MNWDEWVWGTKTLTISELGWAVRHGKGRGGWGGLPGCDPAGSHPNGGRGALPGWGRVGHGRDSFYATHLACHGGASLNPKQLLRDSPTLCSSDSVGTLAMAPMAGWRCERECKRDGRHLGGCQDRDATPTRRLTALATVPHHDGRHSRVLPGT